ncbi:MAG: transporter [Tannerella sp.]|nr:transporter [Tannerella sp.]
MKKDFFFVFMLMFVLLLSNQGISYAQMKGDHLLGDYGLAAGTQAPPSILVAVPIYGYNASNFRNSDGDKKDAPHLGAYLVGVGGTVVTNFKILNANYGAGLLFCFASNKIDGTYIQADNSIAFSDTYVQPIQLGWHWKRADLTVGYALYMPTGKYEYKGDDNSGLGMWTNEFSVGGTWYMDKKRSFNLSTMAYYEIHSKKKDTDIRVGNILTLEGGLAKTFEIPISKSQVPMAINVGPVYYAQFKITNDDIPVGELDFTGDKDHIYGLGVEANIMYPKTFTTLSARWLGEMGAKNRFQGNTFMITIAQPIKFFTKK